MFRIKRLNTLSGAAVVVLLGALGLYALRLIAPDHRPHSSHSIDVKSTGRPAIGGSFDLLDTQGNVVTERNLLGHYTLVYFGFTTCPDVCPLDMQRITLALEKLSSKVQWEKNLVPVFITIDPARDTPVVIRNFLQHFHPKFLGLTGSPENITIAMRAYKVGVQLDKEHQSDDSEMHTSYIYLMNPSGQFVWHFDETITADSLADVLAHHLRRSDRQS